jgi:hypothetical protein
VFLVIIHTPSKSILVNGRPHTVGGVSSERFATFKEASEFRADIMTDRTAWVSRVLNRVSTNRLHIP